MIKNLKELATFIGTDEKTLKDAFSKEEEVEITIPQGTLMNDEKLTELKENIAREKYNEGKTAGSEIYAKELKKIAGIEEGTPGKGVNDVFTLLNEKISSDLKIEPEKKVKELQNSLETIQNKYQGLLETTEKQKTTYEKAIASERIEKKLLREIPKDITGIKHDQLVTLLQSEYSIDMTEDQGLVFSKDGAVIKNNLEKPVASSEIINTFITENGWNNKQGGKGDGDYTGGDGSFKTRRDAFKFMEENNIDPSSDKGQKLTEGLK